MRARAMVSASVVTIHVRGVFVFKKKPASGPESGLGGSEMWKRDRPFRTVKFSGGDSKHQGQGGGRIQDYRLTRLWPAHHTLASSS